MHKPTGSKLLFSPDLTDLFSPQNTAGRLPFVSVIMPVRNEEAYLPRSLSSVLEQTYPEDRYEVIVCDGMSCDSTREVVRSLSQGRPGVQLLENPGRIVPTAMNIALQHARGEIVLRVDGHCEIEPQHMWRCVTYLMETDAGGVGGPIDTIGETPLAQIIAVAMSSTFGVGGSAFRTHREGTQLVDTIPFPAYRRSVIDDAGPYNEELVRNQDDEYNYRLRKRGVSLLMAGDLLSRYYSRGSMKKLWRQHFQYGFWKVRVLQMHPAQMRLRQFVPAAFVGALLLSVLLALFSHWGLWAVGLVAGSYFFANVFAAIGTFWNRGSDLPSGRWRILAAPTLSVAFAAMHVGYGLGFLTGLVRFAGRWWSQRPSVIPRQDSAEQTAVKHHSSSNLSVASGNSPSGH